MSAPPVTPACCPHFHSAVELVGKRWTGAILYVLLRNDGPMRFSEIAHAVPDLSDRLLSERMKELERREHRQAPRRGDQPGARRVRADRARAGAEDGARRAQDLGRPLVGLKRSGPRVHLVAAGGGLVSRSVPPEDDRPKTQDDVKALVQERGIRFIRLWFTDILGQLKSFAINAEELDDAFEGGMGFDGSSITGFNAIEESDMIAMPDPTTFNVLPWRPEENGGGVARMFADVLTPEREPYEGDPRHVLRRAVQRANEMGFDDFFVGPELEYFLFRDSKSTEPLDLGGYFDLTTLDAGSDVRRDTVLALEKLGIQVEYSHHEVGPSQHEIDMRYADALKMADDCMTYRITVKEIALKYGWHATFMPKPLFGENGSGMHTHQSLFKDGRNAFYDENDKYFLSETGKAFIAGQLRHAREICSIFAQWVNSYKRLVPGYEAPVYVAWSRRNRSALVRVPLYHPGKEQATRMELRCPDPACNPYLTFSALLMAGLEGVERGYELPEPMEKNLYHLSPDERRRLGIEQLPETLGEAIEITSESELVLRTLGEHIFNRYIEIKRQEWEDYRVQVTPWELDRYLAIL